MASIVVAGDTSGTVTLTAPLVAGTTTLTLPTVNGTVLTNASSIARSQLPAGSVLQVVSANKTNTEAITTSTFTTVTGLSLSITPSSTSSRILVMSTLNYAAVVSWNSSSMRLYRNETPIFLGDAQSGYTQVTSSLAFQSVEARADLMFLRSIQYVDSPATTSAITYSIRVADFDDGGGTIWINRPAGTSTAVGLGASSIIAMEIAG